MKKAGKILGVILLVLIAAFVTITACHNVRHSKNVMRQGRESGMKQTEHYRNRMPQHMRRGSMQYMHHGMRHGQQQGIYQGQRQGMRPDRAMRPGMGSGMRRDLTNNMRRGMSGGMGQGMGQGMMRGMRPGINNGMGNMPMQQMNPPDYGMVGPAGIFIDKIPNVTEKQKIEYADLLQKQKDEMTKMRADMAAKIKSTLESQRSKMLNLFTSEQKKYIGAK